MNDTAGADIRSKRRPCLRRLRLLYLRQRLRRRHLHGGLLHRILGESLFDTRLWKPERKTFAAGMAIGLFVGLMPTYWVQIILAVLIVYAFRVNITAGVLGTLITNPFTTLPIVGMQVKVGAWLIGKTDPEDLERYGGIMKVIFGHGKQYLVGSFVTATLAAIIGYFVVLIFWQAGTKVKEVRARHRDSHPS